MFILLLAWGWKSRGKMCMCLCTRIHHVSSYTCWICYWSDWSTAIIYVSSNRIVPISRPNDSSKSLFSLSSLLRNPRGWRNQWPSATHSHVFARRSGNCSKLSAAFYHILPLRWGFQRAWNITFNSSCTSFSRSYSIIFQSAFSPLPEHVTVLCQCSATSRLHF